MSWDLLGTLILTAGWIFWPAWVLRLRREVQDVRRERDYWHKSHGAAMKNSISPEARNYYRTEFEKENRCLTTR